MSIVGVAICALAVYRLWETPLRMAAAATGGIALAALCGRLLAARRGQPPARVLTALQHIAVALGAFFLFTSLALL